MIDTCLVSSSPLLLPSFSLFFSCSHILVYYDPTSLSKALRIIEADAIQFVEFIKPNETEALLLATKLDPTLNANGILSSPPSLFLLPSPPLPSPPSSLPHILHSASIDEIGLTLSKAVANVLISRGSQGIALFQRGKERRDFPALPPSSVVNVPLFIHLLLVAPLPFLLLLLRLRVPGTLSTAE